jgi:Domain of Unknown Function (DUF1543)
MPKLFLVYLGGRAPKANIELHDVQFVAGDSIDDTFEQLRQRWFGTVQGLHLDAYLEVKFVDGFRIELQRDPSAQPEKLYFVNLGGYDPASVAELHQFGLFAATTVTDAKDKAKQSLLTRSLQQHKDDLFDVDDCIPVGEVVGFFVHLVPDSRTQPFVPDWFGYRVIG